MRRTFLGLTTMLLLICNVAAGQALRTWISGAGSDSNACSRTAPCASWAGAYAVTAAGGEIDALDPGYFGGLTISHSITLDGGGGQGASVLVGLTNGIVVQAAPGDAVILRNLRINGVRYYTFPGLNGIRFLSGGLLIIESCDVFGFQTHGLDQAGGSQSIIRNSTFMNNGGAGISISGGSASVEDSNVSGNANGLAVYASGKVTVVRTTAALSSSSGFVNTSGELNLSDCTASGNGYGVNAGGIIRLSNVTVTNNTRGLSKFSSGQIISWGNNHVTGNGTTIAPTSTISPL